MVKESHANFCQIPDSSDNVPAELSGKSTQLPNVATINIYVVLYKLALQAEFTPFQHHVLGTINAISRFPKEKKRRFYEGIVPVRCSLVSLAGLGSQGAGILAISARFWSASTSFIRSR